MIRPRILPLLQGATLINRLGRLLPLVFICSMISGCDSGIKEGFPSEPFKSAQTAEFKDLMKKANGKMMRKNVVKPSGGNTPTKEGS
jgi:hypothetical protein